MQTKLLMAILLVLVIASHSALATITIYWTDSDSIHRINEDGTGNQEIITGVVSTGLAIDPVGAKLYFHDESVGALLRSNLDGTDIETLVSDPLLTIRSIAVDPNANSVFWSEDIPSVLKTGRLQGDLMPETLFSQVVDGYKGLAVDPLTQTLYWGNTITETIRSVGYDGDNDTDVVTTGIMALSRNRPTENSLPESA